MNKESDSMGVFDKLRKKYTEKQFNTLRKFLDEQPEVCIFSGGKRAGKTFLLILLFLIEAKKHKGKQFIIVGSNISAVKRNIINEMENYLGTQIKLGKSNDFELFGNKVTVFQGSNADCWKSIRGFTSHLTLINEATAQHEDTIKECFDRTSGEGAKVLADTNTSNPYHFFKTNFIDKDGTRDENGKLKIMVEHFTLFDNTFLSKDYINRQLVLYAEGSCDYLREIMGSWVGKEGVIYSMFRKEKHIRDSIPPNEGIVKYFAGVDWGYEHYGSIIVIAKTRSGKFYVVDEIAEQYKDIDWWFEKATELHKQYGIVKFYCDSARPEYVKKFQSKLPSIEAKKSVIEGISLVGKMLNEDRLIIIGTRVKKLVEEMYQYVWKGGSSEEPRKEFDDCQDSLRYALYSEDYEEKINSQYSNFTGGKSNSMFGGR